MLKQAEYSRKTHTAYYFSSNTDSNLSTKVRAVSFVFRFFGNRIDFWQEKLMFDIYKFSNTKSTLFVSQFIGHKLKINEIPWFESGICSTLAPT